MKGSDSKRVIVMVGLLFVEMVDVVAMTKQQI
jgi:hypothetical protein